jgi:hypothetical protein
MKATTSMNCIAMIQQLDSVLNAQSYSMLKAAEELQGVNKGGSLIKVGHPVAFLRSLHGIVQSGGTPLLR